MELAKKPLLSIFIAAYNTPDYTRKTLQSIVDQVYRPIEIVFSDDCSPISLEPLIKEFRCYESSDFIIRYFRQKLNLGGVSNAIFCFNQCSGKYIVNMHHDDWWTDRLFLLETIDLMENNSNCFLCVANFKVEKSEGELMIKLPECLDAKNKWQIIQGDVYINLLGPNKIGSPAYSAIVFNRFIGLTLGVYHTPFILSNKEADTLGLFPDEFFAFQFLLASAGEVAITEKIVGIRGRPETSACNSPLWQRTLGQAAFVIYYNIYKANLNGIYAKTVKKCAKEMLFIYPVEKINFKILKYYDWALDAIWLMILSFIKHLSRIPKYYLRFFIRTVYELRNDRLKNVIKKILQKIKKRGFFKSLTPFS